MAKHLEANNKLGNLIELFPSIDQSIIKITLNEANGDIGKAIVLLIQTPATIAKLNDLMSSESEPILVDPFHDETTDDEVAEKIQFMSNKISNNGGKCWQIVSVIFWTIVTVLIGALFIYGLIMQDIYVAVSASVEIIFPMAIIFGIYKYRVWSKWLIIIWSSTHGVVILYSAFKWHGIDGEYLSTYIGIVFVFWSAVFISNYTFFAKLDEAQELFRKEMDLETAY